MNKNDLRYIKTENIIKNTFIDLIEEVGLKKTTISLICEKALISRNTFYLHYETIDDLIDSIYEDIRKDFENQYPGFVDIEESTKWYIDVVGANRRTIRALLNCSTLHFNEILFECVIRKPVLTIFDDFDKRINDIRVQMNIEYMLNAMIFYTKCWLENDTLISKDTVCNDLIKLCAMPTELFLEKLAKTNQK